MPLGCRQSRHLSRNQDFDLFKQKNKQMGSIGLKALKPTVFLVGNEFRLRIPFGKLVRFPNPSVLWDNFIDSLKAQRKLCLLGYITPHLSLTWHLLLGRRRTLPTGRRLPPSLSGTAFGLGRLPWKGSCHEVTEGFGLKSLTFLLKYGVFWYIIY